MEPHRKAILCLCCDTHTLQVRQMLLEHFGYLVFATNSVQDAENIAQDRCPDMLLMDNSHPEVDPEQVARQVKTKCPDMIAVVLSPYYYGAGNAGRSAVDRFVTSNDGPDVLISQIEELLGGRSRGCDSMSRRM
jgi:CheY-like chemotaxis protein